MGKQISRGELQSSATIAKTAQTLVGFEIPVGGFDTLTLFIEYTKGDETGLILQPHYLYALAGTAFRDVSWSAAAGTKLATVNEFKITATADRVIVFDLRGVEFFRLTQGGSDNDGTPTGTLAVNYIATGI